MFEHGRLAAPLLLPLALVHGQEAAWGQCAPEVLPALLNLCGESSRKRNELGLRCVYVLLSGLVASMPRNGFILLNEFHGRGNVLVPLPPKHVGVLSFLRPLQERHIPRMYIQ